MRNQFAKSIFEISKKDTREDFNSSRRDNPKQPEPAPKSKISNFSNSFKNSEERNIFKDSYLYFYEKDFDSQVNSLLDKKTTLMLSPKDYDLIDSFLEKINYFMQIIESLRGFYF